jgi:hypothetical protein
MKGIQSSKMKKIKMIVDIKLQVIEITLKKKMHCEKIESINEK